MTDHRRPDDPAAADPAAGEAELMQRLRGLHRPVPDPLASARIHRRARKLYLTAAPAADAGPIGRLLASGARLYARVEPALAATVVLGYLGWAVETVLAIVR